MKIKSFFYVPAIYILAIIIFPVFSIASNNKSTAVIKNIEGYAVVDRGGESIDATLGMILNSEDIIEVDKGSTVSVYFSELDASGVVTGRDSISIGELHEKLENDLKRAYLKNKIELLKQRKDEFKIKDSDVSEAESDGGDSKEKFNRRAFKLNRKGLR